jgi:hypothetical protein
MPNRQRHRSPFRKAKPAEGVNNNVDILRIENRLRMFAYYHTLAWQILGAILAIAVALATLPFLATKPNIDANFFLITDGVAVALLIIGGFGVYWLRRLGDRWIRLPIQVPQNQQDKWERAVNPQARIDIVEKGKWKAPSSPRTKTTYIGLVVFIFLGVLYVVISICFWLWACPNWFLR